MKCKSVEAFAILCELKPYVSLKLFSKLPKPLIIFLHSFLEDVCSSFAKMHTWWHLMANLLVSPKFENQKNVPMFADLKCFHCFRIAIKKFLLLVQEFSRFFFYNTYIKMLIKIIRIWAIKNLRR